MSEHKEYVCPQCGKDPNGGEIHALTHHSWPPMSVDDAKKQLADIFSIPVSPPEQGDDHEGEIEKIGKNWDDVFALPHGNVERMLRGVMLPKVQKLEWDRDCARNQVDDLEKSHKELLQEIERLKREIEHVRGIAVSQAERFGDECYEFNEKIKGESMALIKWAYANGYKFNGTVWLFRKPYARKNNVHSIEELYEKFTAALSEGKKD